MKNNILLYFAKYLDCENKENIVYSEDYKNIELKENRLTVTRKITGVENIAVEEKIKISK